jgi:hypothetical protein
VAWNRPFLRLLDFPDTLAFVGAPFEGFIRYNAERGEYGAGDAERRCPTASTLRERFEPHDFERVRPTARCCRFAAFRCLAIGFVTLYSDITAQRSGAELADPGACSRPGARAWPNARRTSAQRARRCASSPTRCRR